MTTWTAECADCPEQYTGPDVLKVSNWAEDHGRSEQHSVVVERVTSGSVS